MEASNRPIEILLVEDSPSDTELMIQAFKKNQVFHRLHHVEDGVEAMSFLNRQDSYAEAPRPDLILLDLNLPRKDGREVLSELKAHLDLQTIPVLVLTASEAEQDIFNAYRLKANCYIKKPIDFERLAEVVRDIEHFWLEVVKLPRRS
jgi:CheY-like chemotaxis protein